MTSLVGWLSSDRLQNPSLDPLTRLVHEAARAPLPELAKGWSTWSIASTSPVIRRGNEGGRVSVPIWRPASLGDRASSARASVNPQTRHAAGISRRVGPEVLFAVVTDDEASQRTARILEQFEQQKPRYLAFAEGLRVLCKQLCGDEGIAIDSVTARVKESSSMADKVRQRETYRTLEDVTDACGVRIVTRYQEDIDKVVSLLRHEFTVVEEVVHGQDSPDAFGYTSTHLIVGLSSPRSKLREWTVARDLRAEIQVRSILQHAWASISHGLDYKTGVDVPQKARRRLFRVAALLETSDELFNAFRDDVTQIRQAYRSDVASEDWRALPIDLDSVQEAWSRLPMEATSQAAVSAGWEPVAEEDRERLWTERQSELVQAARELKLNTLGDLADRLASISDQPAPLARVREEAEKVDPGWRPWAIPADVAVIYWKVTGAAQLQDLTPYVPALETAIRTMTGELTRPTGKPGSTVQ